MTAAEKAQPAESTRLADLIAAVAASGDRVAFRHLFEHFAPRVKSFMLRQGAAPDVAEEIVQETMVNVWRKAGQFDPAKASASTWIFTIARNMRIDLIRKQRRPEPDMNDPAFVPDPEPAADQTLEQDQEAAKLRAAVATLPEEQQAVVELAFFKEMAHARIAEKLDIPLGTVKSRIRLALKRVRAELGDRQ